MIEIKTGRRCELGACTNSFSAGSDGIKSETRSSTHVSRSVTTSITRSGSNNDRRHGINSDRQVREAV